MISAPLFLRTDDESTEVTGSIKIKWGIFIWHTCRINTNQEQDYKKENRKEMYIVRNNNTPEENGTPTLAIIRNLPLNRISPVFADCSLEELEYFLNRAIQQEEYELCKHLRDLIEFRYNSCVA